MPKKPFIVITMPAYNEESSIGKVISGIKEVMSHQKYAYKIMIVDDGSKDRTAFVAKQSGAIVFSNNFNRGLAETFKEEIKHALVMGADIIVHTDADGQYNAKDIPVLIHEVEKGYDLVLGDRFSGGVESMPLLKKMGNKMFSKIISCIVGHRINDCQTGFRAFNSNIAKSINMISTHTYTQEQIIKAVKGGYKVKEVPTFFFIRKGKSRLMKNPFEYAVKAWINLLRIFRDYAPLRFFGGIGLFFLIFGLFISFYFLYLHLTSGITGHLGMLFLMLILIFTGIQIVLFGFLADMKNKS